MGVRVECDWCHQAIPAGMPYVTILIEGSYVSGHVANEPVDVGGPARIYCGYDRYEDDDPAAGGWLGGWGHRTGCAQLALAALNGNPIGRADMGMEWKLVARQAPSLRHLIDASVDVLDLDGRVMRAIKQSGITTVHDLAVLTEAQWRAIRGVGDSGPEKIRAALHKHGAADAKKIAAVEAELVA